MRFDNKVALITGASVGIGRAVALLLGERGAKLILVDINGEKLEALKTELKAYTEDVLTFVCDVSDETAVSKVVTESLQGFGKIDILVNNAALWRCKSSFVDTSTEEWKRFIDVNIMGVVYFTKASLPSMIENSYGRVINVASVAGVYGNANMAHYSATKGAVIAFTKALAKEVTGKGVLVNSVSPGSVSPSDISDIDHTQESALSFMGRTGSDRENAELICFLASDEASYISGQNIQIDGCRKKM
ncbi:MAG: SDR family oxidoreductase [Ruminococcaceae bacterium]|nr:SDR family oxidoreductase [Oscillospiraceae bacterium]